MSRPGAIGRKPQRLAGLVSLMRRTLRTLLCGNTFCRIQSFRDLRRASEVPSHLGLSLLQAQRLSVVLVALSCVAGCGRLAERNGELVIRREFHHLAENDPFGENVRLHACPTLHPEVAATLTRENPKRHKHSLSRRCLTAVTTQAG